MNVIRYSKAFKMQCVQEVEAGTACAYDVQRKYEVRGTDTIMRWVRQFGSGKYGKIIRVEKAGEVNLASQLRSELRRVKEALADTYMELALEKAFLVVACERMDQTVEGFKKKHGGRPRTRRSKATRS
jgi:transposase-like protein